MDDVKQVLNSREVITQALTLNTSLTLGASMETANGSATVTISNVAPAGVGTATISKWLTVVGSDGVTYYIPMWT